MSTTTRKDDTNSNDAIEEILKIVAQSKRIQNYDVQIDRHIGDGFTSELYTADIIDKSKNQVFSVAIKMSLESSDDNVVMYKNEIAFYTDLYSAIQALQQDVGLSVAFNNVPQLLAWENEPKRQFLAMENLMPKGYVLYDKQKYLDQDHLEAIFRVYGRFHSLAFILKEKRPRQSEKIKGGFTDLFYKVLDLSEKLFADSLSAGADALDHNTVAYKLSMDLAANVALNFDKTTIYTGNYKCFTHGDCWSNNMLFKYSTSGKIEDIKLVDFQLARESTPVHDLSYFFYSGASKADLDRLEYYLQLYYKEFSSVIKHFNEDPEKTLSYETLVKEWKENALFGLLMGIYLWQVKLTPKEDLMFFVEKEEGVSQEEKLNKLYEVIDVTLKSDRFRERASALLEHAFEFGVLTEERIVLKT